MVVPAAPSSERHSKTVKRDSSNKTFSTFGSSRSITTESSNTHRTPRYGKRRGDGDAKVTEGSFKVVMSTGEVISGDDASSRHSSSSHRRDSRHDRNRGHGSRSQSDVPRKRRRRKHEKSRRQSRGCSRSLEASRRSLEASRSSLHESSTSLGASSRRLGASSRSLGESRRSLVTSRRSLPASLTPSSEYRTCYQEERRCSRKSYTTYKMPEPVNRAQLENGNASGKSNGSRNSISLAFRMRSFKLNMLRFKWLKLTQLLLATYIGILTFVNMGPPGGLRDTETGSIIDKASPERTANGLILVNGTERAIVAASLTQVACIGVARLSAWLMYPALVMVFFSKFRATIAFLSTTPIEIYMHSDSHELHVYCGWSILILASLHSIAHLVRWAEQGNLNLLFNHFSGLTGLFIISTCLLISIPMTLFRDRIKYEVRKSFHYLFIPFALALCFHTPTSAIPNGGFTFSVFGTLLVWYFLDFVFCHFYMAEKVNTTQFSVLPSGVRATMNVSKRFQKMGAQGGICYICLPWVSKNQWHAFSLFENPENPEERQVFIQKTGDWTTKVHQILQRDTVRPAWIIGPFPSPYDNAIDYDNQILVASGIGITPALSVIQAHQNSRRINLIWAVRDPHLLEFFLRHLYLDHQGWNLIFYTGKEELKSSLIESIANTNICIIEGRPKLNEIIPNIIFGIESEKGLPELYNPETRAIASEMLVERLEDTDRPEEVAFYAQELGFSLPADAIDDSIRSSLRYSLRSGRDVDSSRTSASECIIENLAIGFRPWEYHPKAADYTKNLDKKMVIPTWGMLYCGGAKPVLDDLKRISDEYQICLHVESFAW